MSLKFEIETWVTALDAYKQQDYELAIDLFGRIEPNSKMLVNIALIYAALGEHELAVENFRTATTLDPYLAVAYFQAGVSNFILGEFQQAYEDFEDALDHLRGNQAINYEQLGLKFILFSAEVIFNKGLALLRLGRREEGMQFMHTSQMDKVTPEHDVIDEAIEDRGEGYTVFSISLGLLYEPSAMKVKNSKARDWLGKAKLITSDARDADTEFISRKQRSQSEAAIPPMPAKETPAPAKDVSALSRSRSATVPSKISDPELAPPKPLTRGATTGSPRVTFTDQKNSSIKPSGTSNSLPSSLPSLPQSVRSAAQGNSRPPLHLDLQPRPRAAISRSPSNSSKSLSSVNADDEDDRDVGIVDPIAGNPARAGKGLTQIYDGLLDSYSPVKASPPPTAPLPPVPLAPPRVVVNRSRSQNDQDSSAGSIPRRRPTLRGGYGGATRSSAAVSRYDEISADWNGMEYEIYEREPSFTKIRIKLFYEDDTRGMAIPPSMPFDDFMERVCVKFGRGFGELRMQFEDEDGAKVSLRDESDYEMAIETARENAKDRSEGKLSIWCENY